MRMLLVEEHEDTALVTARLLLKDGHHVLLVSSLHSARQILAEAFPFDAIVCSLTLPDGNGLDLVRGLRSIGDETPVIALSSLAAMGDRPASLAAGCGWHIPKPLIIDPLRQAIAQIKPRRSPPDPPRSLGESIPGTGE